MQQMLTSGASKRKHTEVFMFYYFSFSAGLYLFKAQHGESDRPPPPANIKVIRDQIRKSFI